MSYIHDQLNKNSGVKNPLSKISKTLTKDTSIIFIDEFQVEDVADAMIIGDLLKLISGHGTKIILTSNAHPNDLYLDGLQRQKFLGSLKIFLKNVNIHKLDGDIDYRTRNIIKFDEHDSNKIISDVEISNFIIDNFGLDQQKSDQISINDRKFTCKLVSNNILWIEFNDFFRKATGSKDYTYISNKFDWVFISNFKKNNDDSIDVIRRFISFIDITYTNRTKIKFFFNDIDIENIYTGSKIENLWVRCKSRLSEMRTQKYLTNN
jgi:cell division protein ZapE